ncbi:MAG TPA: peptide-methionine (S)-S-oxide reductase MsrA [Chthoniobacterales bacterium]|nr:peptide-methionine (S)-S-oxide reductase MsrA [Chthoniobacterales bacterium]
MFRTFVVALATIFAGFSSSPAQEPATPAQTKTAIFAGGCFWCMQPPFDKAKGVVKTVVGYCGGGEANPTYEQVSGKKTGHRESIEITYDPAQTSYAELLEIFWRQMNPTQANGQFADIGLPYKAAIFYSKEEEKKLAEQSKEALAKSGKFAQPIVTDLLQAAPFYPAEEYHQKYYQKNAAEYKAYYVGSGRAGFLQKIWGAPSY